MQMQRMTQAEKIDETKQRIANFYRARTRPGEWAGQIAQFERQLAELLAGLAEHGPMPDRVY